MGELSLSDRDLLVRQRTQTINALRAHLAKQGIVAPTGPAHIRRLAAIIDGDDGMLPAAVRGGCGNLNSRYKWIFRAKAA
jgi:transposase